MASLRFVGDDSFTYVVQVFEVTVDNAVPVVDAGSDVTVDEGSSVEFAGSYSDTGANDTHTA